MEGDIGAETSEEETGSAGDIVDGGDCIDEEAGEGLLNSGMS